MLYFRFYVFDQILSEYLYLDVIYPKIALESTEKAATRFANHYNKEFKASPDFFYECYVSFYVNNKLINQ